MKIVSHCSSRSRYNINDLRNHPYFIDENGNNVFLQVENQSIKRVQASCLLEEDIKPMNLCTTYHPSEDPYVYEFPDFFQFGWENPRRNH